MNSDDAAALVLAHYGLSVTCTPLAGERDLNFKCITNPSSPDNSAEEYIFKVQAQQESKLIAAQNQLLEFLESDRGHAAVSGVTLTEPRLISAVNGERLVNLDDNRIGRLLTWVPGTMWSDEQTHNDIQLSSLGMAVAQLDKALAQFPAPQDFASHSFGWNVLQTENLVSHIELIADESVRAVVRTILTDFVENVLPILKAMPHQVIHNDGNDNNIVMSGNNVTSLIDFGDIIVAPRICGLAVACAYGIEHDNDPIFGLLPLVAGYHQIAPLRAEELEILFPLIKTRIATSIVMAAIQSAAAPGNEYLLISQAKFNRLVMLLAATSHDHSHFRFRNACGYEGCPTSRAVRHWLQTGIPRIADVVMPPLEQTAKIWFDWSITGHGAPKTADEIAAAMRDAGAALAIGNFCEDRNVYEGDNYEVASATRRTVHLGVDLFAPAGTPVYAALDGVVELFNDNFAPLDYGPVIVLRHETGDGIPFWTLYGHLSRPSLVPLFIGKPIAAGDQIATMGEEFENVGWAPHTHFQLLTSLVDMGVDVYGVAPLNELPLWRSISPNPNIVLRLAEGTDSHAHMAATTLAQERKVVLSRALSLNFRDPIEIVRGEGAYLFDNSGRPFLDLVNNVAHVGHSHPRVVRAGQEQMALLNTNTRYLNQHAIEYARSLASTLPDPLNVVFFVNSGSEANDLALRLARTHTKAHGMVVLDHAYHGHITSIIDISPYKFARKGGTGRPDHVRVVPTPDSYKGLHRGADAGIKYAAEFDTQLADLGMPLCAFISESIVSTAGQITLADGFLPLAYKSARAAGGVCIADEVQIGMGRVGEHFWGFELHGVIPDIVTIGKPLGNGHPIAAVVTTPEIATSFINGMEYFNTFGGNPVSAAIGQAVLDVVTEQGLQANARHMGNYLMDNVRTLSHSIDAIGDVRGSGLFIGVELVTDPATQTPATQLTDDLIQFAKERGIFLSCDGPDNNVLKIKPPLVVSQSDIDLFLSVFEDGLKSLR